jgi:hypothetical protein
VDGRCAIQTVSVINPPFPVMETPIRDADKMHFAGLQHKHVNFGRAQTIDDNAIINTYILFIVSGGTWIWVGISHHVAN